MIKITPEQMQTAKKSMYVGTYGIVNLRFVDGYENLFKKILLIEASCGRGKTTYALDTSSKGLLAEINWYRNWLNIFDPYMEDIKPCEMVFLTSRAATKLQQLKNKNVVPMKATDFSDDLIFEMDDINKIRVATAHQFGQWVKKGLIKRPPKVIILDELHSILAETVFADDLLQTIDYVKEHYDEIIKIGLTATPQFLYDYIAPKDEKLSFIRIDQELGSKYNVNDVTALVNGSLDTVLKGFKFDKDNKALVYTQSAKKCHKIATEHGEDAGFIISEYNESKDANGEYLADIMEKQGVRQYIIDNEELPQDVNLVVMNSSTREGLNIKDPAVKTIICEAVDLITIEQILGRFRGDLDKFIIVCNFRNRERNKKNIKEFADFINKLATAKSEEERQMFLYGRYERQEENKNLQKIVYKYKDEYRINEYAKAYLQYVDESYMQIANREYQHIEKVGDRQLCFTLDDYINKLEKYTENKIKIEELTKASINLNHDTVIKAFTTIEADWIDKPLTTTDKKELVATLGAIQSKGRKANWKTVKDLLIDNGYEVTDKRMSIDKKQIRVSVITKEKQEECKDE